MPKCYLHGSLVEKKDDEETKPTPKKSMNKEHPGFSDPSLNYQQNLALILTPNDSEKQAKREQELLKKVNHWQANYHFLAQQTIKDQQTIADLKKELNIISGSKTAAKTGSGIEKFRISQLEKTLAPFTEKEMDLEELKRVHAELAPYFQQLGLTKTWQYFSEICLDYFDGIDKDETEREREREREMKI